MLPKRLAVMLTSLLSNTEHDMRTQSREELSPEDQLECDEEESLDGEDISEEEVSKDNEIDKNKKEAFMDEIDKNKKEAFVDEIDKNKKEAFVDCFPILHTPKALPPIKPKQAPSQPTGFSCSPPAPSIHPFAPTNFKDPSKSQPMVILVPTDHSVILHKQVFGPNMQSLEGEAQTTGPSQQTLIIPYHPSYTGGVPPIPASCNDTTVSVECSVYNNLDSSNPNWLPGLPRPPPGVFVEAPRNRSKRERLRYLSQLNSYNSPSPQIPSATWKLNSFLLMVFIVVCIGSFIKDRVCNGLELSCSYENRYIRPQDNIEQTTAYNNDEYDDDDDIFKQKENIMQNANLDVNLPVDKDMLANIRNISAANLQSCSILAEPRLVILLISATIAMCLQQSPF